MLGWKDKLAEKLSTLLSDSSSPLYSLPFDPSTAPPQPQGAPLITDQFYGPDTSSLSAFLLSLLPAVGPGFNENNANETGEDEASSSSHSGTLGQQRETGNFARKDELLEYRLAHESEDTREEDSEVYAEENEWQLVTETDIKTYDISEHSRSSKRMMMSLPDLSVDSAFLSDNLREFVGSSLPTLVRGCKWILLYSTLKHGISLLTLFRKSADLPGPCLLVTGDMQGAVFGALLNGPLKPTPKKKYQGTNQTFVFTTLYGEPRLFRPTGANRYFFLCMNDMLALGGGGNFALCLDGDLLNGTSGPCETFGNLCLAHSPEFPLKNVELWGFAHTSRYLS
eukprot:Gb_21407 [translate_table: standard]